VKTLQKTDTQTNRAARRRGKRTARKPSSPHDLLPIDPDRFYRKSEIIQRRFYGYGPTQFDEKVKAGEIELLSLSESGRGVGAFGRTILAWQAARPARKSA
jgi:hypothetical protein